MRVIDQRAERDSWSLLKSIIRYSYTRDCIEHALKLNALGHRIEGRATTHPLERDFNVPVRVDGEWEEIPRRVVEAGRKGTILMAGPEPGPQVRLTIRPLEDLERDCSLRGSTPRLDVSENGIPIPETARLPLRLSRRFGLADKSGNQRLMLAIGIDVLLYLNCQNFCGDHLGVQEFHDATKFIGNRIGDKDEPKPASPTSLTRNIRSRSIALSDIVKRPDCQRQSTGGEGSERQTRGAHEGHTEAQIRGNPRAATRASSRRARRQSRVDSEAGHP